MSNGTIPSGLSGLASGKLPEERLIGTLASTDGAAGPTLIVIAGIHGNECAGLTAARRVFRRLKRGDVSVRGELVAFAGNVAAMNQGKRYIVRDLNRVWTEAHVAAVEAKEAAGLELDAEELEQLEILTEVRSAIRRAKGPVYLVDLHTTSAHGVPFVLFGDTLAQRSFVSPLPLPLIIGLEEQVDGTLSSYWTRHGCVTFTCEGGQHDDPGSIDNLEAVILLGAEAAGLFDKGAVEETRAAHALLEARRGNLPRFMEVVKRHAIAPDDAFKMEPGFKNLDHARAEQLLARDRRGEIRAESDGLVIMPLYQGQGNDGFFWGRAVSDARLRASERLRHMKLDRYLDLLPGVTRSKDVPSRFTVDLRIAKLYPLTVFHMLGYRRIRSTANEMTVERQPEELQGLTGSGALR